MKNAKTLNHRANDYLGPFKKAVEAVMLRRTEHNHRVAMLSELSEAAYYLQVMMNDEQDNYDPDVLDEIDWVELEEMMELINLKARTIGGHRWDTE